MQKTEIIKMLKEFYLKLKNTDIQFLDALEGAKLIDLYADVQNSIIYLETGQDTEFNPDWEA